MRCICVTAIEETELAGAQRRGQTNRDFAVEVICADGSLKRNWKQCTRQCGTARAGAMTVMMGHRECSPAPAGPASRGTCRVSTQIQR